MATLILSAIGASLGGALGAGFLGIAGAAVGQAAGAAVGRAIDQKLMGVGSESVEVGRIDRFRLMGAGEGTAIPRVWGRYRVGGQVIWASRFKEESRRKSSGKGGGSRASVTTYSYSVSLAVALCEGPIRSVGRVWADGNEIAVSSLSMRVYEGSEDQLPDPLIEAIEGTDAGCAYRGTAYVVIEDLDLGRFGNRVPQFSFEVIRSGVTDSRTATLADTVRAVALIPGTGEYALATSTVRLEGAPGASRPVNVHTAEGISDLSVSLSQLRQELPKVDAVSLVVSWFGDDLRCGSCTIRPKVEQQLVDSRNMPWRAGGIVRASAEVLSTLSGNSVYGGSPCDQSVIEAIVALRASGREVMLYPFILMEILSGNGKADPWVPEREQPQLPWRGRITLDMAPGVPGSVDGTAEAALHVAAFFGSAEPSDFHVTAGRILYTGPAEWSYRRFVLHYAHLCAQAGGVDAFCIGSELRGLTRIRDDRDNFPAVAELIRLSDDVRAILGSGAKIGYAADWSEYANYASGENLYFNLDPLWAHANIDFVGIDNYLPLSDWRDGEDHLDRAWGSCANPAYLSANVAGGEWFDWYYDSDEGARDQRRLPITDDLYEEPWVYRSKDIRGWWENSHFDRIGAERRATPWVPGAKPIWFTECGCPAVAYGTNQPNAFVDQKSAESSLPRGSGGVRDDFIQMQYFAVLFDFWSTPENNPVSATYGGAMVDMAHAFAWAWDSRPFPAFPTHGDTWSDGSNYELGHWLNGRSASECAENVIRELAVEIAKEIGQVDLGFVVRGYGLDRLTSARSAIQPLALAFGFDVIEREGAVDLRRRSVDNSTEIESGTHVVEQELNGQIELGLTGAEMEARSWIVGYLRDQGSFEATTAQSLQAPAAGGGSSQTELPLLLTAQEARTLAERWHTESGLGRETVKLALPLSQSGIGPGDVLGVNGRRFRADRVDRSDHLLVEGVRIDRSAYQAVPGVPELNPAFAPVAAAAPESVFLDLPLMRGDEVPHAPHIAVTAAPWPGPVAVWDAMGEDGFDLNTLVTAPAVIGLTRSILPAAQIGLPDRGAPLRVAFGVPDLSGADWEAVLAGANFAAIGSGAAEGWEIFQFSEAVLVGPDEFELSLRLRGQFGTDGDMPAEWPIGSLVVLLDGALRQIELAPNQRGLVRTYRIGVSVLGYADSAAETRLQTFSGIGLRPYPVAHLRIAPDLSGGMAVGWVRRTRIDGDNWDGWDVPLGEDREWYQVRVYADDSLVREEQVATPGWNYAATQLAADRMAGSLTIRVSQGSDRYGPGPYRAIAVPDL